MKPSAPAPSLPHRQHGAASVAIAALLMFILAAAVLGVMNMSGSSAIDAAKNEEQISTLFLAESGLERGEGILTSASDPTVGSVCTGISGSNFSLGRGKFNLSATPLGCVGGLNCTSCKITSTGIVGSSSRTVVRVMSLSSPSGGAFGCGGGGALSPCPVTGTPAGDFYPDILQNIDVTTPPAILLSNMAYSRHPGGANNINATGCVALNLTGGGSTTCITQWNDESNHSNGSSVVGSRGASAYISAAGSYQMKQNLDAASLFAAVGVRVSGNSPSIVGSYWDDNSGNGQATAAGNATASGQTNNGAACNPSPGPCVAATPPPAVIPNPPSSGSLQTSNSWCYDADTLVFGFSGNSNNSLNGALTSFVFGTAPESTPVPYGTAGYPKIGTEIYSSLRYISNPSYMSATDAVSGAVVTGYVGTSFTAALTKNQQYLQATGVTGAALTNSSVLTATDLPLGTTIITCVGINPGTGTACGTGFDGAYNLSQQASKTKSEPVVVNSSILTVTAATKPYLAVGDTIYGASVTANTTITSLGTGTGGTGTYNLSAPQTVASTTITSNGTTVSTPSSWIAPTVGTYIAASWTGSLKGVLAPGTTVASVVDATKFTLSARPTTPLSGDKICGGICAFFNHSSAAAKTNFTIAITNTSQWAAGMTCLKGIDTSTMTGLIGTGKKTQPANWYEPVQ